jgi:hypothetical protein
MSVFCRFLEDLEEGIYIQHSLESVLINELNPALWKEWHTIQSETYHDKSL